QSRYPGGVVFTTAASDMETVAEAVRSGAFDYLVKPIAYERLGPTTTLILAAAICCWRQTRRWHLRGTLRSTWYGWRNSRWRRAKA
ncbi:hypothetical protein MJM95_30200, partial [Salmonella enterica subsp. enterica serovar Anatum]|nr:hypothetical protein [Salmonella enterica subsp. enterica serovar Anatum]